MPVRHPRPAGLGPRRRNLLLLATAALVVTPLVEIVVLVRVGRRLGAAPTIALLVLLSLCGAWIIRRQGATVWRELSASLTAGRRPSTALADAALFTLGGVLLLLPGLVTDVLGLVLVLPPSRTAVRYALTRLLRSRLARIENRIRLATPSTDPTRPRPVVTGEVVEGVVVDDRPVTAPGPHLPPYEPPERR